MRGLREGYLSSASGDEPLAAALLARALMQGDPSTLKAGYAREDALWAACEQFRFEKDDRQWQRTAALLDAITTID